MDHPISNIIALAMSAIVAVIIISVAVRAYNETIPIIEAYQDDIDMRDKMKSYAELAMYDFENVSGADIISAIYKYTGTDNDALIIVVKQNDSTISYDKVPEEGLSLLEQRYNPTDIYNASLIYGENNQIVKILFERWFYIPEANSIFKIAIVIILSLIIIAIIFSSIKISQKLENNYNKAIESSINMNNYEGYEEVITDRASITSLVIREINNIDIYFKDISEGNKINNLSNIKSIFNSHTQYQIHIIYANSEKLIETDLVKNEKTTPIMLIKGVD